MSIKLTATQAQRAGVGKLFPKRKKQLPKVNPYLETINAFCRNFEIGLPITEFEFGKAIGRRWRFDFLWLNGPSDRGVALEVNGGAFVQGRHSRGVSQIADWEKLNWAQILGYTVIQCSPQQVKNGEAMRLVAHALGIKEQP